MCASSSTGIFAFFAFMTINLNVMVDIMFSAMINIMINGTFAGLPGNWFNSYICRLSLVRNIKSVKFVANKLVLFLFLSNLRRQQ